MTNDFVTDADGKRSFTPASVDRVDVASADAAALDLDINIVVAELLWFELLVSATSICRRPGGFSTSCFLKSVHFFWSPIMKPSKVSG